MSLEIIQMKIGSVSYGITRDFGIKYYTNVSGNNTDENNMERPEAQSKTHPKHQKKK